MNYTYDSGKMRQCAEEILADLQTYQAAKEASDNLVTGLASNWNDEVNRAYSRKYTAEAKVAAENVHALMKQFAELLTASAEAFEKLQNNALNNING